MSDCFITRRGGSGSGKAFAAIGVTYPTGSICTCTDGIKTLKLKNTSGQGFFLIPYAGTWTVTCTDGTNTKSESVEITSRWQSVDVALGYALILFDGGAVVPWTARAANPTATIGTTLYVVAQHSSTNVKSEITTTDKIDVSEYSTLNFNVSACDSSRAYVGISSSTNNVAAVGGSPPSSAAAYAHTTSTGVYSIDISGLTGAYYVFLGTGGFGAATLRIDKVWLE